MRRLSHPRITQTQRHAVAAEARGFIAEPYSAWEAIVSKLVPGRLPRRRALYCSTLVAFAVADAAAGLDLASDPKWRPLYPAMLASHPWLDDVLLEWRQL